VDRAEHVVTRQRAGLAVIALAVLLAALVDVRQLESRVHVRWRGDVSAAARATLERRYGLEQGARVEGSTWRYELSNRSQENVDALRGDGRVADTAYLEEALTQGGRRRVRVTADRFRALAGPAPAELLQPQSGILVVAGGLLLWAAGMSAARRRTVALAVLLAIGIAAYAVPLRQPIRMGDSLTYTGTRAQFDDYTGVRQIRFEAHLSHAVLGRLAAGQSLSAASRAFWTLMHAGTAWFLSMALIVGVVEAWSPAAVRYLALALMGPATLMFFGYLEIGQLSLNLAAFPLAVRGLKTGSRHLEAAGALAGFGAALHGFGLLSVAGLALAALARLTSPVVDGVRRHGLAGVVDAWRRLLPWSGVLYLGWVAIYLVVLKLPMVPGHAEAIPLRPWLVDEVGRRVNAAIVSARGVRDVLATAAIVGLPLLAVTASLRRRMPFDAGAALLYAIPSVAFAIMFWPVQGLAVEMDLVFAAFPAVYALAWVCAQDGRRAIIAAAILVFAHLAFWRVVLDTAFVNSPI
jgi:hypothetical protein